MESSRCPVVYKKLILMPTTWRKARRVVKEGKGIFVRDKVLGVYLKLKYNPIKEGDKPNKNQQVVLGIDPGSWFDGFTVVSKSDNRNFQFNHQLPILSKLKGLMNKRKMYRRLRRYRLRHRPMRVDSRTGKKITNTGNYYFQNRVNMIHRIVNLYPITTISIEDVKFNHFISDRGRSFSNIEIGKIRLYDYIIRILKMNLIKCRGFDTKDMRETLFPDRTKDKDKSMRNFDSHCIDSYTIGILGYVDLTKDYRSFSYLPIKKSYSTSVRFIDRVKYLYRRELHRLKNKIRNSRFYFRYNPKGVKVVVDHKSKLKKSRFRSDSIRSNHGDIWSYSYTKPESTYKKFLARYGGSTITVGRSKCEYLGNPSKYWNGEFYRYYNIEVSY